jgi:hypothetical protein
VSGGRTLRSAALSLAVLAGAWAGWGLLGEAVARLGLARFDPLARVALGFAALTALEAALARLNPPSDPH